MASIECLMKSVIDYAGLFPPAAESMQEACRKYLRYRAGKHRWMLGRFIIPIARLPELRVCVGAEPLSNEDRDLRFSVIGSGDAASDLQTILEFNKRNRRSVIDTVEVKVLHPGEIADIGDALGSRFHVYAEVPLDGDSRSFLDAVKAAGIRAKIRTGGMKPEMVPSTAQVAHFISACAEKSVPFKATAGLHHAIRAVHSLTDDPSGETTRMHGFLNILTASASACGQAEPWLMEEILNEEDPGAFSFADVDIVWRGRRITSQDLADMRERLFLSFGSCSFEEPVSELEALGLL